MPDDQAPLRVLHLEGEPHDQELIAAQLSADGLVCDIVSVTSREQFEAALSNVFDVILADDRLPSFEGTEALALARARTPHVPFVFVSGTRGEEVAVERLKAGATDYVLKHRLDRLSPAITRARAEAEGRAERQAAEAEVHRLNVELALRASEERLKAILDHSPSMVSLKDLKGRYLFVNRAFERTYGFDRAHVIGRTDSDLFAPRLAEKYRVSDEQAIGAEGVLRVEEPSVHGGRVCIHAASRFALVDLDGAPSALCCIADDITDRKQAEDDIKMSRLEAERANRAKSEFLSRMSHDLRTPLNAVLGFAQLLGAEELTGSQRECVQQILLGGRHLLELVNEVLDIARIESGRLSLSPEPVRASDPVRDVVDLMAPLAAARGITLAVEEGLCAGWWVLADRQRLNQILMNLVSNAVKYNRPSGRVTVSCAAPTADRLRIVVADTGPGIPRQKLQLAFRPFERLGAERTGVEGTGLGLTLARGLAEAMGGTLGVESEVDRGSTFWVELTQARGVPGFVEPPLRPMSFAPVHSAARAVVLYIEDNISNVRLMQKLLQARPSITLVHAPDGETGLSIARRRRPNLVLLDLHLPDMPGQEVLRRIGADSQLRGVPVAVLSADATPGRVRRVLADGAAAYLTKPLDLRQVLEVIEHLLAGRRSPQSHAVPEVSE